MGDYYDYSSDEEVIEFRRRNEEAKKAREKARKQFFEENEHTDTDRVRQLARDVTTRISDEYSEALSKTQEKDRQTLEYIDQLLNETSRPYGTLRKHATPITRYYRRAEPGPALDGQDVNDVSEHRTNTLKTEYRIPYYRSRCSTNSVCSSDRSNSVYPKLVEGRPSETARQRVRRIETHLDGILDYEVPSAENFKNMRHSLRDINDKIVTHKLLLDRGAEVNLDEDTRKVSERIDSKYRELEERMPELSVSERGRTKQHSSAFDPTMIPGYITGLSITNSDQNAELRGRIRTLLCRTRRTTGSYDAHTNTARKRREATMKG